MGRRKPVNLLIINCPKSGRIAADEDKFAEMVDVLNYGGISARYLPVYSELQLLNALSSNHVDIIFSADHSIFTHGNEQTGIHLLLDQLKIPYIGSGDEALHLALSKAELKKRWQTIGVQTPKFFTFHKEDAGEDEEHLLQSITDFPYLIKPDGLGNSRGIKDSSIVDDVPSLTKKVNLALDEFDTILVEKYLGDSNDIREFTVAMLGNGAGRILMPCEIKLKISKPRRIITTEDKDNHNTQASPINETSLKERVIKFAEKAFAVADFRDYARLDILSVGDELNAIEINGQPMVPDKWFENCCVGIGLSKVQYINALVLAGIVRNKRQGFPKLEIPPEMSRILPAEIYQRIVS
jgi:D-alanine-D-alanine ligase-like ATP-grasp enzyme